MYVTFPDFSGTINLKTRAGDFNKLATECQKIANERILEELNGRGVRQRDIAEVCSMTRASISRWFSGQLFLPSQYYYTINTQFLPGLSIHEMMFGEDKPIVLPSFLSVFLTGVGSKRGKVLPSVTEQHIAEVWDKQDKLDFSETPTSLFFDRIQELSDERFTNWKNFGTYNVTELKFARKDGRSLGLQPILISRFNTRSNARAIPNVSTIMMCCLGLNVSADYLLSPDYTDTSTTILVPRRQALPTAQGEQKNIRRYMNVPDFAPRVLRDETARYALKIFLRLPEEKRMAYWVDVMKFTGAI